MSTKKGGAYKRITTQSGKTRVLRNRKVKLSDHRVTIFLHLLMHIAILNFKNKNKSKSFFAEIQNFDQS
jgi:hypothetical protein